VYVIVLKIHASIEDKIEDAKHSFYKNFEHVFDIYRQTENESSQEIINDNIVTVVNFATSKNLTAKKYLGTTVTNQNLIPEEIKRRLKILVMLATNQSREYTRL
jgi:hypothetical protein